MNQSGISVSQSRLWRASVADLAHAAGLAGADREVEVLRAAFALMSAAPAGCVDWLPARRRFEGLLQAGAGMSAALTLVPAAAGFMLSRGPNRDVLASVILPGQPVDQLCDAATPALALVAALLLSLGENEEPIEALTLPRGSWLN